jgi:hypothetical protein
MHLRPPARACLTESGNTGRPRLASSRPSSRGACPCVAGSARRQSRAVGRDSAPRDRGAIRNRIKPVRRRASSTMRGSRGSPGDCERGYSRSAAALSSQGDSYQSNSQSDCCERPCVLLDTTDEGSAHRAKGKKGCGRPGSKGCHRGAGAGETGDPRGRTRGRRPIIMPLASAG